MGHSALLQLSGRIRTVSFRVSWNEAHVLFGLACRWAGRVLFDESRSFRPLSVPLPPPYGWHKRCWGDSGTRGVVLSVWAGTMETPEAPKLIQDFIHACALMASILKDGRSLTSLETHLLEAHLRQVTAELKMKTMRERQANDTMVKRPHCLEGRQPDGSHSVREGGQNKGVHP